MSMNRSDWVVIGVDIGIEHDDYSDFIDQYAGQNKVGDMTFLIDGMRGDYFIVGEVVAYGDEYEGFGVTEMPIDNSEKFKEIASNVMSFVKMNFMMDEYPEPKLIVLTHWT